MVAALKAVEPYDWATFLRERLEAIDKPPPLDGLARGGYRLVFTDVPSAILAASDTQRKHVDLLFSIGVEINDEDLARQGILSVVAHNSAAFKANLSEGGQILAVNGIAYDADVLKYAIRAAKDHAEPDRTDRACGGSLSGGAAGLP